MLRFKERKREVWGPGYSELFFLDEVTALAAGHRPCFECRRRDAEAFRGAFADAVGVAHAALSAEAIDERLHAERTRQDRTQALWASLPVGTLVETSQGVLAKAPHGAIGWSFGGYQSSYTPSGSDRIRLLTPPSTVAALRAGYRPSWHPSASEGTHHG
ncbi:MAG: hypothetical protein AAF739_01155 [Pseudomonadota bacterium]